MKKTKIKKPKPVEIPQGYASKIKYDFAPLYDGSFIERAVKSSTSTRNNMIGAVRRHIERKKLKWVIVTRKLTIKDKDVIRLFRDLDAEKENRKKG